MISRTFRRSRSGTAADRLDSIIPLAKSVWVIGHAPDSKPSSFPGSAGIQLMGSPFPKWTLSGNFFLIMHPRNCITIELSKKAGKLNVFVG